MSGGSWNYVYHNVNDAAYRLENTVEKEPEDDFGYVRSLDPAIVRDRIAFGGLLEVVAQTLRAVEWHDSGDFGPDNESKAFNKLWEYIAGMQNLRS